MIPSLAPGESKTLAFDETMNSPAAMPGQFTNQVSANESEHDANPSDNTDIISFATGWVIGGNQHGSELKLNESSNATSTLPPGSTVHYTIDFRNTDRGGIAYGTTLHQTLYDPMGKPIGSGTWPVGRINPGDAYQIKFDIQFPDDVPSGYYTSIASLEGVDDYGVAHASSSASVYIVNPSDQPHAPVIVNVPAPTFKKGTTVKTSSAQSQAKPNKANIQPAAIKFPFIAATAQAVASSAPLP